MDLWKLESELGSDNFGTSSHGYDVLINDGEEDIAKGDTNK